MKNKVISLLLACFILLTIPVQAGSLDKLKEKLQDNSQTKKEIIKKIDINKASTKELKTEISKLDKDIETVEEEISILQSDIENTQKTLNGVSDELDEAKNKKEKQKLALDERLRVMYMYTDLNYFEILFSSTSLSDLITKIEVLKTIVEYDQKTFEELETIEKAINDKKAQIEQKKSDLLKLKSESQLKMTKLNNVKVTRGSYLSKLNVDIKKLEADLKLEEAESNSL